MMTLTTAHEEPTMSTDRPMTLTEILALKDTNPVLYARLTGSLRDDSKSARRSARRITRKLEQSDRNAERRNAAEL